MSSCCCASLTVSESGSAALRVVDDSALALGVGGSMYAVGPPFYEGSYDITPSGERQVVHMDGMRASGDLVIEPIPSNYGLITWDGSTITVS